MDKIKLLIVEDDKSLLDLYNFAIPDGIFEKRLVDNGLKALEVYSLWRPDIILLDILLPKMMGDAVLKEIRESFNDKSTAVIVSSVIDEDSEIRHWEILGIQGYVVKPFDYQTIAGKILNDYKQIRPEVANNALIQLEKFQYQKRV